MSDKRVVQNILAVFSILFFWGIWRKIFSSISLKKKEEQSDPDVDYLMLWKEGIELSPAQKDKIYELIGDEKRLSEVGVTNPDALTVQKIKEYTMNRVAVRGIRFKEYQTKAVEEKTFVYALRAPFKLLCAQAEKLEIRKELVQTSPPLKNNSPKVATSSTSTNLRPNASVETESGPVLPTARTWRDRTTAVFSLAQGEHFKSFNSTKNRSFFTSQERQTVIEHLLLSIRAVRDKRCLVSLLESQGVLEYFPLHDNHDKRRVAKLLNEKPNDNKALWNVAQYFGTEVAFYFGWISFYSSWLVAPAVLGLLLHIYNNYFIGDGTLDTFTVLYSIGISLWSTTYLEFWKRRNSVLSFEWNTDRLQEQERWADPRPEFKGEIRVSPITDKPELYYPTTTRRLKYLVTYPIIFLCLFLSAGLMLTCFAMSDYLEGVGKRKYFTKFTFLNDHLSLLPTIAYSILVPILNVAYTQLANRLNDWENHRTTMAYENAHIFKLILFWFINSYLSLFYIAFVQLDLARLRNQLASLLVTSQLLWNAQEILTPFIQEKYKIWTTIQAAKKVEGEEANIHLNPIETELQMSPAGPMFDEYIKIVIQFGYVTLFGCVWPLAAFMALLNNQIEIRSDLWKLTSVLRRPPGKKASDIGSWYYVLEFMSLAAVITNFAFLGAYMLFSHPADKVTNLTHNFYAHGFSFWSYDFVNLPIITKLVLLLLGEHFVVGLKVILAALIPDVPGDVDKLKAREYYIQHQMLLEANSEDPTPSKDYDDEEVEESKDFKNSKETKEAKERQFKVDEANKSRGQQVFEEELKREAAALKDLERRKEEEERMRAKTQVHKTQVEQVLVPVQTIVIEEKPILVNTTVVAGKARSASEIIAERSKGVVVDSIPSIGQI